MFWNFWIRSLLASAGLKGPPRESPPLMGQEMFDTFILKELLSHSVQVSSLLIFVSFFNQWFFGISWLGVWWDQPRESPPILKELLSHSVQVSSLLIFVSFFNQWFFGISWLGVWWVWVHPEMFDTFMTESTGWGICKYTKMFKTLFKCPSMRLTGTTKKKITTNQVCVA